jgi:formylmethanofuran dehydrogenase subunit E-like metal-binding protein
MSTQNPYNNVKKRPGKGMAQMGTGGSGLPSFSAPNAADTEKNRLHGFGAEVDGEINYLKRLSLRAKLAKNPAYSKFVPDLSELEIMTSNYLDQLNALSRDPAQQMVLQNLYSKFNSTSVFNIAQELAQLRMARDSVAQLESLVENGIESWIEKSTGQTSDAAKRASRRQAFAVAGARVP